MRNSDDTGSWRALAVGRRGSVAIWIATMMPGLLVAVSLGVEVGGWAAAQVAVQRSADVAAIAGGINYLATKNPQTAATFAARLAQLNGGSGTTSPSWNSGTNTLTDNLITAQVVTGYETATDTALKVTVQKSIPAGISSTFSSVKTYTITGTGVAELVSVTGGTGGGGQPCLLTLSTSGNDITISGSAEVIGTSCVIRSNASITMSGSSEISAQAVYTAGNISLSGSASVTATEHTSAGTIGDPFAAYSPVQTALAALGSGGSSYSLSGSNTATINPGTYSSINVSGSAVLTLQPGLYVINGNFSVSGSAKVNGAGVTIVTSGSVMISGSAKSTLSSPDTSPTGSAVPGFVFIGKGSSTWTFSGSDGTALTGIVYGASVALSYSGSAISSSSGCLEFVTNTANLSGSATLSGGCQSFGAPAFGALASTVQSRLVH
jgi:hypothetical protein